MRATYISDRMGCFTTRAAGRPWHQLLGDQTGRQEVALPSAFHRLALMVDMICTDVLSMAVTWSFHNYVLIPVRKIHIREAHILFCRDIGEKKIITH